MNQLQRIAQDELRRVRKAAEKATLATAARDETILTAHANGHPLRKIAEAAGVSHEQVRRIVSR